MKDNFLARSLLFLMLHLSSANIIADDGDLAFKIKAGYLYNFTKFVTWPEIKGPSFNLCILGADPFGADIDPIEQKTAFGLPIKIIRLDEVGFLSRPSLESECHILYVNADVNQKTVIDRILASTSKAGTLIVGENESFAAAGGMIGFVNRSGKIKLQINLQSSKKNGLKISAKLLEIAELIEDKS